MQNPRLASQYEKSLLDLAVEKDQLEQVHNDMLILQRMIRSSRELVALLRSPVVSPDKKQSVILALTNGRVSDMTAAFIRLLINKLREETLPEVITAFIQQYKQHKNIHTVKLTTAVPVSEEVKKAIVSQVQATGHDMQNIELETAVDPSLIGGFVLQSGDKLVDASVSNSLKEVL